MATVRLTLDKFLKKENITRYELSKRTGVKFQTIDGYYKNRIIRYDSYILAQICSALECDIKDIIEFTGDS
ncbi:MAG: helix-turn-helix transcriptional regulator [Oscillospiraceae bacterium]|jgi:putative transcriptional regulator|nr:helix-turn-helix transcriptional regulator [Oscillospiraceae bacterium]